VRHTRLTVWLLRLGVDVIHGRPRHPQTQGKEERFHRTLVVEVLQGRIFADLGECQRRFDAWRQIYNYDRPHEALDLRVPASRYQDSPRPFPEQPPVWEYGSTDEVRKVQGKGEIYFRGQPWLVGEAFRGERVAVRPTPQDGVWKIFFGVHPVAEIDAHADNQPKANALTMSPNTY